MDESPVLLLLLLGAGGYFAKLWLEDYRAQQAAGRALAGAMPGAFPASGRAIGIAVAGALVLLAAETYGEIRLGLDQEQSEMTVLFGLYTLVAALIEEVVFRGYLVITQRGSVVRWLGIIGASVVFALFHPFLWTWEDGDWTWTFNAKGGFSTAAIFLGSLWFYYVRFMPTNPRHSLLPCVAAHATKNFGVLVIKGVQGFVTGLW